MLKGTWGSSSTSSFKEVNHSWGVIDPDGLDLLRVQMYFLRVSEDVRQQNPFINNLDSTRALIGREECLHDGM